jgi:hypothetical protein
MTRIDGGKWELNPKPILIRLSLAGFFLGLVFLFVYRYCEQAGTVAQKSCVAAMIGSLVAGAAVFWPVLGSYHKDTQRMVMSIFIAGVIRLLIGFIAVVIILFSMTVSVGWFLGCYGIFYAAFVTADTWLIVRLFQGRPPEKDDSEYEYEYRAGGQRKRSRRDYQ